MFPTSRLLTNSDAKGAQDTPNKPTTVSDFSDPFASTPTFAPADDQPVKRKTRRGGRGSAIRRVGKEFECKSSDAMPDPVLPVTAEAIAIVTVHEVVLAQDE